MQEYYENYRTRLRDTLQSITIESIYHLENRIMNCYKNSQSIYIMGNGGSASAASHWACDFSKGTFVQGKKSLRVIGLADNMALFSAIANDMGYESVFAFQLQTLLKKGDLVIGISASGNSMNIVRAFEYAKSIGAETFAVVGFSGGKMKEIADSSIYIPNGEYGIVEDIHMILDHMIMPRIRYRIEHEEY